MEADDARAARHRELAAQLASIGPIATGSVVRRYTRCANPNCRCNADPPLPHGPYWQWTTKKNGKTITRRLTEDQARAYQQWIDNDRQLRAIINQMRDLTTQTQV
ncbi:MAG: hypothetical protein LBC97_06020 [Bifidobacteriaceae bacterium]|jgi:hypothetical protein|nr:hypothetical protein [Bifidobacteriaceae bacterium]